MDKMIVEYLKKKIQFSESGQLYQSVDGVEEATRDMKARWELYDIGVAKLHQKTILDIGCNIGGFSEFCTDTCLLYQGIDIDPESIKLARHLYPFDNCSFVVGSFVGMSISVKYDILFSFAVWYYTQVPFLDYVAKLHSLLTDKGTLYFESHANDSFESVREVFEEYFKVVRVIKTPTVSDRKDLGYRFFAELERK